MLFDEENDLEYLWRRFLKIFKEKEALFSSDKVNNLI